jgi:predicted  nucleic acid-binding Zn ribbon protein
MTMHNVLLKFTFEDPEAVDDERPGWLLSSFYQKGQLIDYFHIPTINDNTVIYTGAIIQPDSLDSKYCTPTAKGWLQEFPEQYGIKFEFDITGEIAGDIVNDLQDVSAFILKFGGASPVRSLDTFANVPLYLLPKTSFDGENYINITSWERSYEAIEGLWWRGNVDEPYFYDQLTKYNSALSQKGMNICEQISSLTTKDCYFHLFRDMNPDVPDFENCPKCNGPWKLQEELFDTYLYKCDKCFLIS